MSTTKPRDARPVAIESTSVSVSNNGSDGCNPIDTKPVDTIDPVVDITNSFSNLGLHHAPKRHLFRVVCDQSWGSATLNDDILPEDLTARPWENPNFHWRSWLLNHGNRHGGPSMATSLTADFLRAITIALQYKSQNKTNIAIIVIREEFLTEGTCHAFDALITWSDLPKTDFGKVKKNEFLVIGPIPAHAIVSRITFNSLEAWNFESLFPQLHAREYRKVNKVRKQMRADAIHFNPSSVPTTLFLVAVLGHQYGAFPNELANWQLLIHFTALANRQLHVQDTASYESSLDSETLSELEKIAGNIKTMQKQNRAVFLGEEERVRSGFANIEEAVKDWARRNPLTNHVVT